MSANEKFIDIEGYLFFFSYAVHSMLFGSFGLFELYKLYENDKGLNRYRSRNRTEKFCIKNKKKYNKTEDFMNS